MTKSQTGASLPTDVPRTESERRVWAIFENARASTISLVNSEKEGEFASLPTDVPRTESERRVWAIFENARVSTISLVNSEKEGEFVSEDLLNARIRTCR